MRVLIVNSVCGIGSTGRICTDLYDELVSDGHECCIAYGRGTAPNQYNTYKIGNKVDNYWHVLETRLFDNHGFASRRATKKFVDFIDAYSPDIIHLHNLHGYYLNVKYLFSYLNKKDIKIFWTFHDCWNFSPHSAYIDRVANNELPTRNTYSSERLEYPKSLFISRSRHNYNKKKKIFTVNNNLNIITPSKWLEGLVKSSFFSNNEIITINNGIDLNAFYRDDTTYLKRLLELEDKKILLGVANIWEPRKGLNTFNNIAQGISDEFQVILVGKIPAGVKIHSKIIVLDQVNSTEELRKIYSSAYIFINPTSVDNYPTTNLEASACGVPIITSSVGGTPETIQKGRGIIFQNFDDLLNKISFLGWFNENIEFDSKKIDKEVSFKKYLEVFERR